MKHSDTLGMSVDFEVVQIKKGNATNTITSVATEVPLTIVANDEEIATLSGSPDHLREFVYGFLFTAGFIQKAHDVQAFWCDETKWRIEVKLNNPPEPNLLTKRLYTSGCGRGVMFSVWLNSLYKDLLQMNLQLTAVLFLDLCDGCKPHRNFIEAQKESIPLH